VRQHAPTPEWRYAHTPGTQKKFAPVFARQSLLCWQLSLRLLRHKEEAAQTGTLHTLPQRRRVNINARESPQDNIRRAASCIAPPCDGIEHQLRARFLSSTASFSPSILFTPTSPTLHDYKESR
jgi:hypothetical protein